MNSNLEEQEKCWDLLEWDQMESEAFLKPLFTSTLLCWMLQGLFCMDPIIILLGVFGMLLGGGLYVVQRKRILESKTEYLSAKMEGFDGEICDSRIGDKQKRGYELSHWRGEGQELVDKAKCLLSQPVLGGDWKNFLMTAKMLWDVENLIDALEAHDKKGDVLFRDESHVSKARGLYRGCYIPVKPLVGHVASTALCQLEFLLQNGVAGRIVIHGVEGVGKTKLMKHLHNIVLKWVDMFDHVIWVTFPDQCTVKHLQDAVAAAVKCDLGTNDNLNGRAKKLSDALAGLGSFVLFLDGVPAAEFSVGQVGIPVLAEGSYCKLVLTTRSTMESRFFYGSEAVRLDVLAPEEAYELFKQEAGIGKMYDSSFGDTPRLLADMCKRVPRSIVNVATRMCGIEDPCEWRYALFESGFRGDKGFNPDLLPIDSRETERKLTGVGYGSYPGHC